MTIKDPFFPDSSLSSVRSFWTEKGDWGKEMVGVKNGSDDHDDDDDDDMLCWCFLGCPNDGRRLWCAIRTHNWRETVLDALANGALSGKQWKEMMKGRKKTLLG